MRLVRFGEEGGDIGEGNQGAWFREDEQCEGLRV